MDRRKRYSCSLAWQKDSFWFGRSNDEKIREADWIRTRVEKINAAEMAERGLWIAKASWQPSKQIKRSKERIRTKRKIVKDCKK